MMNMAVEVRGKSEEFRIMRRSCSVDVGKREARVERMNDREMKGEEFLVRLKMMHREVEVE